MKTSAVFTIENNQRKSYEVEISVEGFKHQDTLYNWNTLKLSIGGNKKNLLFVKSQNFNCYIRLDKELRNVLSSISNEELKALVEIHKKEHFYEKSILGTVIAIFIIGFGCLFIFRSEIVQNIVESIPYEYEEQIGEQINNTASLSAGGKLVNKQLQKELEKIIAPLKTVVPEQYKNLKVSISPSRDLNAFATPGGYITVNLGLLEQSESCDEVLGVLAHEAAHITERHVLTGLVQSLSLFTLATFIFGDISGIIAVLADSGTNLINLSFSRDIEKEADEIGLQYMAKLGRNEEGIVTFLNRLNKLKTEKGNVGEVLEQAEKFLSTHPVTKDRIKHLKEYARTLTIHHERSACDYSEMKKILATL